MEIIQIEVIQVFKNMIKFTQINGGNTNKPQVDYLYGWYYPTILCQFALQ
jgi:hypothetical protein